MTKKKYNNKKYNRRGTKKREIQVGGKPSLFENLCLRLRNNLPDTLNGSNGLVYKINLKYKKKELDIKYLNTTSKKIIRYYKLHHTFIFENKTDSSTIDEINKFEELFKNQKTICLYLFIFHNIIQFLNGIDKDVNNLFNNYKFNEETYKLPENLRKKEIKSLNYDIVGGIYENQEKTIKILNLNKKINKSFSRKHNLKLVKNYYNDLMKYFNNKIIFNNENIFIKIEKWSIMNDKINDPNEYFIMEMDRGLSIKLPRNISENSTNEGTSEKKHILTLEDLIKITEKVDKLNNTYKIIHGDLKLDNMIFDKKMNEIIFIDFDDTIINVRDIAKKKNSSNLLPEKPDCIVFPINQIIIEMGGITTLNNDKKMVLYICMLWKLNHNLDKDYDFNLEEDLIKKLKKILKGELLGREDIDIYELLKQLQGIKNENFVENIKEFLKTPKFSVKKEEDEDKIIFTYVTYYVDPEATTFNRIETTISINKEKYNHINSKLNTKKYIYDRNQVHKIFVNELCIPSESHDTGKLPIPQECNIQEKIYYKSGMEETKPHNLNTIAETILLLENDTPVNLLILNTFGYIQNTLFDLIPDNKIINPEKKYPYYYFGDSITNVDSINLSGGFKKNKSKKKNKRLKKNKKYSKLVKK